MAPRKLNVLVYTGTGTTIACVRQCIYTLRRLLGTSYAIIPLTESALLHEPWAPTAALLVLPGGADLSYCRALNGPGNRTIAAFVRRGGAYLGFCAGAYYAAARCEFEVGSPDRAMEVVGPRELAFFPGTCRGGAFKGFRYASEAGARAVGVAVRQEAFDAVARDGGVPLKRFRSYFNGGGVFVGAGKMAEQGVEVLATYEEELDVDGGDGRASAALVYCKVGNGAVILSGPHPEFAAVNLEPHPEVEGYDKLTQAVAEYEHHRTTFLKACLAKLGLEVNAESTSIPSLSKLHLSALDPPVVDELLAVLQPIITKDEDGVELIKGENDIFHLENPDSRWSVTEIQSALEAAQTCTADGKASTKAKPDPAKAAAIDGLADHNLAVQHIIPHATAWPAPTETPYFDHALFYRALRAARRREPPAAYAWGDALLYGEVVTSTNTLLDKNPSLLARLPAGFTVAATTQLGGRGRGANVWLAPPGSTVFSTVVAHPAHLAQARPVVFVQYLAAIAIVEAVCAYDDEDDEGGGGGGACRALPVKLKWPNDVYAQDPADPWKEEEDHHHPVAGAGNNHNNKTRTRTPNYVKIGGILTNCAYSNGAYQLVVGIGLNTTNARPTTSLDAVRAAFGGARGGAAVGTGTGTGSSSSSSSSSSSRSTPPSPAPPFRSERLLARLLARFEALYREFVHSGFTRAMEARYYAHWLHSGQVVTLEDAGAAAGGARARIVGITRDWGLLEAQEVGPDGRATGRRWALQSDENSFDFWRGLVRRKL